MRIVVNSMYTNLKNGGLIAILWRRITTCLRYVCSFWYTSLNYIFLRVLFGGVFRKSVKTNFLEFSANIEQLYLCFFYTPIASIQHKIASVPWRESYFCWNRVLCTSFIHSFSFVFFKLGKYQCMWLLVCDWIIEKMEILSSKYHWNSKMLVTVCDPMIWNSYQTLAFS